jgi:hypothetical protein
MNDTFISVGVSDSAVVRVSLTDLRDHIGADDYDHAIELLTLAQLEKSITFIKGSDNGS